MKPLILSENVPLELLRGGFADAAMNRVFVVFFMVLFGLLSC